MEESMKKLMHNVEILIVTTGNENWRSAADAVLNAKLLLGEIGRDIEMKMHEKEKAEKKKEPRTVRIA